MPLRSLDIKRTADGKLWVPGLTKITVEGPNQIDAIMAHASKNRSVAATKMNERSSRSHSVFTLYLTGTNTGVYFTRIALLFVV